MEEDLYKDLLVELECPICTSYMTPPIRQCSTGHSICDNCRKRLPKCALCKGSFNEARNIALESLAIKIKYPCIYKNSGCDANLLYSEKAFHEITCSFRGVTCALDKCTWIGNVQDLLAHWTCKKTSSKPYGPSNLCHTKMKSETYYVNLVSAHQKLFWFKCKAINKKIFWVVQYIGPIGEAEGYFYEIEAFKPGKPKKKILMSEYCQRYDLDNVQLFKEGSCISIPMEAVEYLINDNQLVYYMRVHEVKGGKGEGKEGSSIDKTIRTRDKSKGPPGARKEFRRKKEKEPNNEPDHEEFLLL